MKFIRGGGTWNFQFAGFSSDSLAERMNDCQCKVLITADCVWRGEKLIGLKKICDDTMEKCKQMGHEIKTCIVVNHLPRLAMSQKKNGVSKKNGIVNGSSAKSNADEKSKSVGKNFSFTCQKCYHRMHLMKWYFLVFLGRGKRFLVARRNGRCWTIVLPRMDGRRRSTIHVVHKVSKNWNKIINIRNEYVINFVFIF